jgi:uncharacterized integral membrane protein
MAIGYVVVAVLAAAVAVFALQNGTATPVRFLAWSLDGVPLAGLILAAFAAGLIIAGVPLALQRWRARSQARRLEAQLSALEGQRIQPPAPPAPRDAAPRPPAQREPTPRPPEAP